MLLVVVLLLGWIESRVWPFPWPPEPMAGRLALAGLMLIAAGLLLELTVAIEFARARTTLMPHRPATALVTGGPFQVSRNPIYVGHLALLTGLGLHQGNAWWLFWVLPLALALDRLAVRPEERHLAARFGPAYEAYCKRTKRWF